MFQVTVKEWKIYVKKKKIKFLKREAKYCKDHKYPWHEIHNSILKKIPGDPYVAWCLTTAPTFLRFDQAIKEFKKNEKKFDSLVGVLPSKIFFLNKSGAPDNFNPGIFFPTCTASAPVFSRFFQCELAVSIKKYAWFA